MNTFGFWLLPPKNIQAEYQEIIDKYSKKLDSPSFEPHITVLDVVTGDKEDIIQKVKAVVSTYKSIHIAFTDISISTTYHHGDISSSEKSKIADEITLNTANFKADRLCIVNADNLDPKTWLHVSEFELSN